MLKIKPILRTDIYTATALRLLLMLFLFQLSRVGFYLFNIEYFAKTDFTSYMQLAYGGFVFDLAAILYTNILYIVMMLLPTWARHNHIYKSVAKWVFLITNSIILFVNTLDYGYYQYTFRRTTAMFFEEFKNESNMVNLLLQSAGEYWYITLICAVFIALMVYGYSAIEVKKPYPIKPQIYYSASLIIFILGMVLFVGGVRGGFTRSTRPITISNATDYITTIGEEAIVLNTPFSIFRTFGEESLPELNFFSKEEINKRQSNIHQSTVVDTLNKKNVVIIIMESFGKEYIGALNKKENIKNYKGYTPFLDSLIGESLCFTNAFSNGRKSIEAMSSILSSIPSFTESFVLSSYSQNSYKSINFFLREKGYNSMFYHGAPNGSMGFSAFAKKIGIEHYIGKNEFNDNSQYDGVWGIWDEPFLKFTANNISEYKEPFIATIFTLSSHHPFKVPKEYEGVFDEGDLPIHKVVGYSDNALKEFFETAKKQDWYDNTLFVITADHTNAQHYQEYNTAKGVYSIPIIFFTPSKELIGEREQIVQQIDIMPTILDYLGYDEQFFSFGNSALTPNGETDFAIFYHNNNYVAVDENYLLIFDGEKPIALYDYRNDWRLATNIIEQEIEGLENIENRTKAFIQSYNNALIYDEMIAK